MVWFSEDVLSTEMIFENYLARLRNIPLEESDDDSLGFAPKKLSSESAKDEEISPAMQVCLSFYASWNFRQIIADYRTVFLTLWSAIISKIIIV